MTSATTKSLGILRLDRFLPAGTVAADPPDGSILHASTFEFPTISEVVVGAGVERVVKGDIGLEPAFIAAANRLVARGAVVIATTCGFAVRHQKALSRAVSVPVVTSSLLLLPLLLRQLPQQAKIAILTYDSTHCSEDLFDLEHEDDRRRIVVGGIEGGKFWHDELKSPPPPVDVHSIEEDVAACIQRLRDSEPDIALILFECAAFPSISASIRRLTKLPLYDITDLCRMTMAAVTLG
ncbi:hypothetical protein [Bradyrhizobium sp. CCGUVB14]|uniref:hypothetical protein n=1 Tax=Bradyrhizobium sp. CCGUVB14 TaxID=2949628 RepID=UPI0020B21BF4|nr:hypothetical protein [Bradyrhizobium sp. CCGUVB14]MCP3441208.1 hypothetical protein [Bradyrhizobium sp. CCGUVB14]